MNREYYSLEQEDYYQYFVNNIHEDEFATLIQEAIAEVTAKELTETFFCKPESFGKLIQEAIIKEIDSQTKQAESEGKNPRQMAEELRAYHGWAFKGIDATGCNDYYLTREERDENEATSC